ncbi:MAG: hypothetical protein ACAI35_27145 [Candidatus Methylacidiphilales bacterium]|nr:hypothetical protein [Candidatus Methylacidiphilales bacterium]
MVNAVQLAERSETPSTPPPSRPTLILYILWKASLFLAYLASVLFLLWGTLVLISFGGMIAYFGIGAPFAGITGSIGIYMLDERLGCKHFCLRVFFMLLLTLTSIIALLPVFFALSFVASFLR